MKHIFTANELACRPVVRFVRGPVSVQPEWTGEVFGYDAKTDTYVVFVGTPEGEIRVRVARTDVELVEVTAPDPDAEQPDRNAAYLAARVIAAAREAHGGTESFDMHTAAYGIERYGEIWNQCMILAKEWMPASPVNDDDAYEAWAKEWRSKAQAVWQTIESELRAYEIRCDHEYYSTRV